jgi:hypothetical protein
MTNAEVQRILEEIIDLARLLGWTSALAQDKNEVILGMYIGENSWINAKLGNTEQKTTH